MYEAQVIVVQFKAILTKGMETWKWHAPLGHCSKNVLQSSRSHNTGAKGSDIGHLNSDCESCIMKNRHKSHVYHVNQTS